MRAIRGFLVLGILLPGAACGGGAAAGTEDSAGPRSRTRSDLITLEEMQQRGQYSNLHDLIEVMRPRWLRPQGPDTFMGPQGQVQVHMDGNRLGSVDVLRNLAAAGVTSIQWIRPIDAAARFGLDHSHGVVLISTSPVD